MLSVVVPTHGRPARLRLTLTALGNAMDREAPGAEVIVVDDGGSEGTAGALEQARSVAPRLPVRLETIPHGGRSAARNAGARLARGRRLLFLDDDVLVLRGTVRMHAAFAAVGSEVVVRGSIAHLPWAAMFDDPELGTTTSGSQPAVPDGIRRSLEKHRIRLDDDGWPSRHVVAQSSRTRFERDLHDWLSRTGPRGRGRWIGNTGAHVSIPADVFHGVGGFDEHMGVRWGAEDLELGFRLERAGVSLLHAPDATVLHMDHGTRGRGGDHEVALRYFAEKHSDPSILRLEAYFAGRCALPEAVAA